MARQIHLTRLALGKSPFEAPEVDEQGNFILGPHVNDFSAENYVQQFDSRGHPYNSVSKEIEYRTIRAKNDVLESAGAVTRKRKQIEYEILHPRDTDFKWAVTVACINTGLTFGALWWLYGLRRRVQLFRSFDSVTLLQALKSELRIVGFKRVFWAGTWAYISRSLIELHCKRIDPVLESFASESEYVDPEKVKLSYQDHVKSVRSVLLLRPMLRYVSLHLQLLTILETVHLFDPMRLSPLSLVPFTRASPLQLPSWPGSITSTWLLSIAGTVFANPLMVMSFYDSLRNSVTQIVEEVILRYMPRRLRPLGLHLSLKPFQVRVDHGILKHHTSLGLGMSLWMGIDPSYQRFRYLLTGVWPKSSPHRMYSIQQLECALYNESANMFRRKVRSVRRRGITLDDIAMRQLALETLNETWSQPQYENPLIQIAVEGWVRAMLADPISDDRAFTPELEGSLDLEPLNPGDQIQDTYPTSLSINDESANQPTSDFRSSSVDAVQLGGDENGRELLVVERAGSGHLFDLLRSIYDTRPEQADLRVPESLSRHQPPGPGTPLPGIMRAQSLGLGHVDARPGAELTSSLKEPPMIFFLPFRSVAITPHVATLLTTAILLPVDDIIVRWVVLRFLSNPATRPGAAEATVMIRSDLRGGIDARGNWNLGYVGNMVLLFGLQGLLSSGVWGIVNWLQGS